MDTTVEKGAAPATAPGSHSHVLRVPIWLLALRALMLIIGLVVLILAGLLLEVPLAPFAFSLVCGLFTIIILAYILVTSILPGARFLYNIFAVVALDALMVIFWFACMCSMAVARGRYRFGNTYAVVDRTLYAPSSLGLDLMLCIAVFAAFEFIVFSLTLIYTILFGLREGLFHFKWPAGSVSTTAPVGAAGAGTAAAAPAPATYEMTPQHHVPGDHTLHHNNAVPTAETTAYQAPYPVDPPYQTAGSPVNQPYQTAGSPVGTAPHSATTPHPPANVQMPTA